MASKRRKSKKSRLQNRSVGKGKGLKTYTLLIGAIFLSVVVVAGFAIFNRDALRRPSRTTDSATVSLDKSEGSANAPVVVVEYGDFQ